MSEQERNEDFFQPEAEAEAEAEEWVRELRPRRAPVGGQRRLAPAFEALYREHYAFAWRCARRLGASDADLDDVLQDTFAIAYRRFATLDPAVRPTTWLFGILRNVLRNRSRGERRHRRRLDALSLQQPPHSVEPVAWAEQLLAQQRLQAFLDQLDPDKRAVFVLAELEGMTSNEIAEALEIKANTASSRLRAARHSFAEQFGIGLSRREVGAVTSILRERAEQPPAGARRRTHALLLASLGSPRLLGASLVLGKLGLTKLAVGLAVSATAVLGLSVSLPSLERDAEAESIEPSSIQRSSRSTLDRSLVAEAPPIEAHLAGDLLADEALIITASTPTAKRSRPVSDSRERAYERLRRAREHLIANEPERALVLLEGSFPIELEGKRVAGLVSSLCRLDRAEQAEREVAALRARDPDSPELDRIDHACW